MELIRNKPISVFLDANVLIAASLSKKGLSFRFITACLRNQFIIMVSRQVLIETERRLKEISEETITEYRYILSQIEAVTTLIIVANPWPKEIEAANQLTHKNDAPILAAAIKANPDYLITYNRDHFIRLKVKAACKFTCITPDWFLRKILKMKSPRKKKKIIVNPSV